MIPEKKFELFMGYFGNGVSVRNRAIREHGAYKYICHIAECGKISWYVQPESIPEKALQEIKQMAEKCNADFEEKLKRMEESQRYFYLCDMVSVDVLSYVSNLEGTMAEKINYLKDAIYQRSTWQ